MKIGSTHIERYLLGTLLLCSCAVTHVHAQTTQGPENTTTLPAGAQYERSGFYQKLWGKHYRKEWTTPVQVPHLYLDTAMGGLVPYQTGGATQTKTLRLRGPGNKEYVLRSVDKSYGTALPEIYKNTFIENLVNDQVSSMHPYAAVTIPSMAKAAGIYHTEPIIRFVPRQPALGEFNDAYGDKLYLLEQRPDENWEDAPNLGNSENIISTQKILEILLNDNKIEVDQ